MSLSVSGGNLRRFLRTQVILIQDRLSGTEESHRQLRYTGLDTQQFSFTSLYLSKQHSLQLCPFKISVVTDGILKICHLSIWNLTNILPTVVNHCPRLSSLKYLQQYLSAVSFTLGKICPVTETLIRYEIFICFYVLLSVAYVPRHSVFYPNSQYIFVYLHVEGISYMLYI